MAARLKVQKNAHAVRPESIGPKDGQVAYVPDSSVADNYVNREVNGVLDFEMLEHCQENGLNVLLLGPTGSGKTMVGAAYAANHGQLYYSLPCVVSIEPSELFGRMMPTETMGEYEWQDGPVTRIVREGGVLNISEINMMPARVAASLYPLLDGRRYIPLLGHSGEIVRAHPDLLIVADMNPKYHGTMELNQALRNRFPVKVQWDYDPAVEDALVKSKTILGLARKIRTMINEVRTPVSTNALMEFVRFGVRFGHAWAVANFVQIFSDAEQVSVKQMLDACEVELKKEIEALVSGPKKADPEDDSEEIELEGEWEENSYDADEFVTEYVPR